MKSRSNNSNILAFLIFLIFLMQFSCPALRAACSGTYQYGANNNNYTIPDDGSWAYSLITISEAPAGATVTCVEVHYEITGPWSGLTRVDLTDWEQDREVTFADYLEGDLIGDYSASSSFDGEPVNQTWILWANGMYVVGPGSIDEWWIKVYYEDGGGGGGYCIASTTYTNYEYISRVQVGDIDKTSGSSGYADYTAYSTQMQVGQGYGITVTNTNGWSTDVCGIWVDWNQDEDFTDAGETISVSGNPSVGPYTATITPPGYATLGETRMRVRIVDPGSGDTLSPCGPADYGEVEDYSIEVIEAQYLPGGITGSKFNDLDSDGNWDGAEDGIGGWEIYLDLNDNGQYDTTEPNVITDVDGYYEFTDIAPGAYIVAEIDRACWRQTFPGPVGTHEIVIDPNEVVENVNFGNYDTGATAVSILAIEDTYVNSSDPCANYGNSNSLSSGYDGSAVYRTFLKFDLSIIPPGNVVTLATLRLNNNFISIPAPELDVYPISDRWDELTVTWNDQPVDIGGIIAINRSMVSGDYTTWDVTEDVDDDYANDGLYSLKIVSPTENVLQMAGFWSKDLGWPPEAPTLEIEYMPIFGGGTGERGDPYQIWTGQQFNTIGLYPNRWNKHYKLMDDISLADYTGPSYNHIGSDPEVIYGDGTFTGVFDGNFHSIADFSVSSNARDYLGLFGSVEGTVKNIKLINPVITTPYTPHSNYIGPIAGYIEGAKIIGCSVIGGTVEGDNWVGGLVGCIKGGNIANSSSSAVVSGDRGIGGLAGDGYMFGAGVITDCYARGDVSGNDYVGGFMGDSHDVLIVNCYSTGSVSGVSNTGGFSGYNSAGFPVEDNVIGCFWDVESSGDPNSAAGTGLTTAEMQNMDSFIDAGWDFLVETANGGSDDWVMLSGGGYPVLWHELPFEPPLPAFAGGSGTVAAPYLIATETQLNSIGHNPRLMDKHFRLISDLDMGGIQFHRIATEPYEFSGTFDGAGYVISDIFIKPSINIVSSIGLIDNLDGTEAEISNLTLTDPNIVSDWGWGVGSLVGINEGGAITNCHAVNANIRGFAGVGGLVGANLWYGRISGCSASGNVSESLVYPVIFSAVGGLVGENSLWSEIESSFAKCNVYGDDCVGGVVGTNIVSSILTNCYSQGTVTGTENYIGGLIGRSHAGTANYCYSGSVVTGPLGTDGVGGLIGRIGGSSEQYTACFWDSEANPSLPGIGNGTDPDVTAKTTAQMQAESTYTSAGWDFLGETANGTEDIWAGLEGVGYPEFVWQGPLAVSLDINKTWMYQGLPDQTNSELNATVSILADPFENTGYTYQWEFILPDDVSIAPVVTQGGTGNSFCTFAAPSCDQPAGLSDSGQALAVRVTVTGTDFGNSKQVQVPFGIALLGDVNNDKAVNVIDRSIVNSFWRLGSAGPFSFTDCNLNCDTDINVVDRSIANAVWRGILGQNSVTCRCPLR
ncbi:MAG TPA: DNRLRE domain-containing protein [Planctomycetes bacterium]|nr:DNRLRE domain-containing protein [Planctomycetota bacterium]